MTSTIPFTYGTFDDVPRMIRFQWNGVWYFLRSYFDEEKDHYNDYYDVYRMPQRSDEEFKANPLYFADLSKAKHLGQIPIEEIGLDPTLRKTIDANKFEKLAVVTKRAIGLGPTGHGIERLGTGFTIYYYHADIHTMNSTIPFSYGDFCDYPRMMRFQWNDAWYYLSSDFNEEKDEHNDYYDVYRMPQRSEEEFQANRLYFTDLNQAKHLGQIPVKEIGLDSTRRRTIDANKFENFLSSQNSR